MAKKLGFFICSGCGIGEALDVAALTKVAAKEYKVPVCHEHACLCSAEGAELIKNEIEAQQLDGVVIAACSSRVNYDVFRFPNVFLERVNLREQVIWSHEPNDEDTQMLAEDNVRMGVVKVQSGEQPTPYIGENLSKTVLVVGGGLAGMTAALEAGKAGYPVVLVEKEASLGGYLNKVYKTTPMAAPFTTPEDPNLAGRIAEIEANPNIKVYTGAVIEKIAGGPGMFDAEINQGGNIIAERVGAIVLATGSKPNLNLDHLGYGKYPNVITHADFEAMAKTGKINAKKVAFIQCAGSRDKERLPYCSAACCVETLKQTTYLKELAPDAMAYVFYKDIRSSGQYEHLYKTAQETGAVFIKGEITGISEANGKLVVESEDVLLGGTARVEDIDLVVLANGMVPTTRATEPIVAAAGADDAAAEAAATQEAAEKILNLQYRQGPELPNLKYGFPDSHFVCFPYETRRTGIYAAGSVRAPMDMAKAVSDATGAALKAIQCVEATAGGAAVHPRSGDLSYPEFALQRCTQCKRCTEECPFGAINEDEKGNPLPNPTRCRRCGTCMGACPERIISFKNYSVGMIGNMVKAVEVPEEDEEKPRILILACENDAIPALDMAGINRLKYNSWVRIVPVRCLGSLNLVWIADSMSKGFDGVLLLGCKHGDDYQCHFMKGSELAEIRLSKVSETLDRLGLESERVRMVQISIMDYAELPGIIDKFAEDLEEFGPNPMKGF
ncbi:methyl-viologen-reducing hydrogenase delta subunit [Desulfotomaculum nigrificans CO-1-SRB]|uniref:Methyl-viologen-reducing hydrogenase delta subunit n=1 Tax=Desulfotomaculum nigrificans (strain DSM 14880 / VKM B-2319 / CO-1-SRB) TaxID=868595 RepID=F6B3Q1_DESCC|nr:hydrogenase iron-sulfur subunit [Desulfotomaculum nigrificans]AEF95210.1 methyl-viologen-reducing hydrogenase delta subunit [Desulfotomaculum nigrificans CO-1-SRB]